MTYRRRYTEASRIAGIVLCPEIIEQLAFADANKSPLTQLGHLRQALVNVESLRKDIQAAIENLSKTVSGVEIVIEASQEEEPV